VATRKAGDLLKERPAQPESLGYSVKNRLLGRPLVNEQLGEQRLSKPLALGVLSPDGISSSAYGTEEILIALLARAGLAAFALLLPMTLAILFVMTLVVLSYREVVMVYIRPGGSYVVARENFGPRIAQIAAVALLIDYVVTVAVQTSAGTAAVVSAIPSLGRYSLVITVAVILLLCYGNLRGLKEAGRAFAVPTYLFAGSVLLMIVVGLVREITTGLPMINMHAQHGLVPIGGGTDGIVSFAMIFTLLRAFANGGASLTGIEAVSDAVGGFRPPEGRNARQVLVAEGIILGLLVAGISWLAHVTHATPYSAGYPTVLAQEAKQVFESGPIGKIAFFFVQAATALILYTGANTSFNGFPFLASYVAGDAFLPRWLLKRGHRLVFSNAIVVLTVTSVALVIVRDANVNSLVPMYAIGVFTAFTMAGFGMARYHKRRREPGWRRRQIINATAGGLSAVIVVIFAVVKFTEGAWVVVVLFPILVWALIRLNREYAMEAEVLTTITGHQPPPLPTYTRRTVYVFVDGFDLATLAGLRYARSLRPTSVRAVHFVIDGPHADKLREQWTAADRGIPLDFIDVPDRRLVQAAADLVSEEVEIPGTHVTVVLPRRSYSPLLGRLLHDRTADRIAGAVSRIPRSAATIIPFDVSSRVELLQERQAAKAAAKDGMAKDGAKDGGQVPPATAPDGQGGSLPVTAGKPGLIPDLPKPEPGQPWVAKPGQEAGPAGGRRSPSTTGASPIGELTRPGRAVVAGRVRSIEIRPVEHNTVLACVIKDKTGELTALFYGRSRIPGVSCGSKVRFHGSVGFRAGRPFMVNPTYELLGAEAATSAEDGQGDGDSSS